MFSPLAAVSVLLLLLEVVGAEEAVLEEAVPGAAGRDLPANTTADQLTQLISPPCEEGETLSCLKSAMAGLVPALAVPRRLVVWPGLALLTGGFPVEPPPAQPARVDGYLLRGLRAFVSSLSLRVKVVDSEVGQRLAKFSRMFADSTAPDSPSDATGRRKKVNNALMMGALLSGGMLFAMGMAGISAMAGKALMMSLLSLGMMLMNRAGNGGSSGGGGGGGHKETTYEIIHTMPSHHDDYGHRQWSDITHEGYHVVKGH